MIARFPHFLQISYLHGPACVLHLIIDRIGRPLFFQMLPPGTLAMEPRGLLGELRDRRRGSHMQPSCWHALHVIPEATVLHWPQV